MILTKQGSNHKKYKLSISIVHWGFRCRNRRLSDLRHVVKWGWLGWMMQSWPSRVGVMMCIIEANNIHITTIEKTQETDRFRCHKPAIRSWLGQLAKASPDAWQPPHPNFPTWGGGLFLEFGYSKSIPVQRCLLLSVRYICPPRTLAMPSTPWLRVLFNREAHIGGPSTLSLSSIPSKPTIIFWQWRAWKSTTKASNLELLIEVQTIKTQLRPGKSLNYRLTSSVQLLIHQLYICHHSTIQSIPSVPTSKPFKTPTSSQFNF